MNKVGKSINADLSIEAQFTQLRTADVVYWVQNDERIIFELKCFKNEMKSKVTTYILKCFVFTTKNYNKTKIAD